jgi:hypothetical protein
MVTVLTDTIRLKMGRSRKNRRRRRRNTRHDFKWTYTARREQRLTDPDLTDPLDALLNPVKNRVLDEIRDRPLESVYNSVRYVQSLGNKVRDLNPIAKRQRKFKRKHIKPIKYHSLNPVTVPIRTWICTQRKIRKEVFHALKLVRGKGAGAGKTTWKSNIKCS